MSSVLGVELPATWSTAPLKHATSLLSRGSAPNYAEVGPVRAISQATNQANGLDWARSRFHDFRGDPKTLKGYLLPGDVLINSTGKGTLGRIGYFTVAPDMHPCMADSHVTVARTRSDILDSRFAYYWLGSLPLQKFMHTALIVGATNQIELNRDRLGEAPIPLPPVEEQRRIAKFLDAETTKVALLRSRFSRLSALLEERQAALLTACFEVSGEPDHSFSLVPLRRIVERWIDYRGSTPEKTSTGIPLVTARNIRNGRIDLSTSREYIAEESYDAWMRRGLLKRADVLLTTEAPLGQVAMVTDPAVALAQRVIVLRANSDKCPDEWLYWYLRSPQAQVELRLRATGSTALGIKADRLRGVPIPIVDRTLAERRLFTLRLQMSQCDELLNKMSLGEELLTERLQTLITAAVTGQFDVSTASGRNVTDGVSA
ncbi:restriction endonuclease subunit S [Streptomyces mutomycini]|uniref:restriction endonuclease subunit S n=1 Tax=Streptomyces mutomycini TaxID=284036 RepID=UPI0034022E06